MGDVLTVAGAIASVKTGHYLEGVSLFCTSALHMLLLRKAPDTSYRMLAMNALSVSGMYVSGPFIEAPICNASWIHLFAWQTHNYRNQALGTLITSDIIGRYATANPRVFDTMVRLIRRLSDIISNKQTDLTPKEINDIAPLYTKARIKSGLIDAPQENDFYENCCSICTNEIDDSPYRILPCKHIFHQKCVDEWLLLYHHDTCTMCLQSIREKKS